MAIPDGLIPAPTILNLEVGEEIVLYLKDVTSFVDALAKARPFNLRVHAGVGRNQFGCLGFFVFWIPSPYNDSIPLAIYDLYVNLASEKQLGMWRELAFQTHWHLLLLDRKDEQRGFFEFINTFRIEEFLKEIQNYCDGIPVLDFDKTKAMFMAEHSVEDLFEAGPRSGTNSGVSVYDKAFAVPETPDRANPLLGAKYVRVIRESVARHSGSDRLPAGRYLEERLRDLRSEVARKSVVYLDVCHWINLRHVWLQSPRALPVYEQILVRLNQLAQRQAVLCPLSAPIFEELMKQLDPRSRAATANLMDIFSQGISVMRFEEAFAQQCCSAMTAEGRSVQMPSNSLSKVGLWFDNQLTKTAWWSPEISAAWDHVSIDLHWELTVCDCQRLTTLGVMPRKANGSCFSNWMELPARQKSCPMPFWDLAKQCREDVVGEYSSRALSHIETILGETKPVDVRERVSSISQEMINSRDYGRIPCCEIVAGMCAAQVVRGGKIRSNDVFDFLHASAGIPASAAYFCDGAMEHLLRSKLLRLDEHFGVRVHSRPEELLGYLETL